MRSRRWTATAIRPDETPDRSTVLEPTLFSGSASTSLSNPHRGIALPKIVDHEERRKELADATLALVARTGINAVTVRTVALESGWSTGVLSHYYGGRADLLLGALRRAAAVARKHFEESLVGFSGDGVAQLEHILESVLPLDERRLALTRIFLFFYAEAAADEEVRSEVAGYLANWRHDVARAVRRAQDEGRLNAAQDPEELATAFVALADALSIHAIFDPALMRRLRKRSPVSTWIAPFVVPPKRTPRVARAKA